MTSQAQRDVDLIQLALGLSRAAAILLRRGGGRPSGGRGEAARDGGAGWWCYPVSENCPVVPL